MPAVDTHLYPPLVFLIISPCLCPVFPLKAHFICLWDTTLTLLLHYFSLSDTDAPSPNSSPYLHTYVDTCANTPECKIITSDGAVPECVKHNIIYKNSCGWKATTTEILIPKLPRMYAEGEKTGKVKYKEKDQTKPLTNSDEMRTKLQTHWFK